MIWDAVSRDWPATAMLSTMGGWSSWASSAAGPPRKRATAARRGRRRCIRTRSEEGAPAPIGAGARRLGLGAGQRPEGQPFAIGRDVHFDFVATTEVAHEDLLAERV